MAQAVRQWTSVSGYEGLYEVSNFGEIRSIFRYKKLLKPSANAKGYLSVELWKNKVGKRLLVHSKARKTAGVYIWKFDKERNVDLSDKVC